MIKVRANKPEASRLLHEGQMALSELEHNGICVDVPYLTKAITDTESQIADIEKQLRSDSVYREWRKVYGDKTKLGSRQQLADLMFNRLGYEKAEGRKNKQRTDESGDSFKKESTSDEASFANVDLPFVKLYFQCEKLKKALSTYFYGIRREMVDGRVHPVFNLHNVVSYRSSADTPNFKNIPSRNKKMAELVRSCYIASPGNHLVELDYAGIEVRISACYNDDTNLIKYINDPSTDMHRDMASYIFMMDREFLVANKDWAKKSVRDWAKNRLVFPFFYGSIAQQCAPDLWRAVLAHRKAGEFMPDGKTTIRKYLKRKGITQLGDCSYEGEPQKGDFVYRVKQAEDYMWNEMFPEYTAWKDAWYKKYLKTGRFAMHTGFEVEALLKKNDVLNYSIQGSAFHCTLQALVWIIKALKKRKMKTKMIGEIYDCLIADVPPDELQDYINLARDIMAVRVPAKWKWIIVPLDVEAEVCEVGESWYLKKVWINEGGTWKLPPPKAA